MSAGREASLIDSGMARVVYFRCAIAISKSNDAFHDFYCCLSDVFDDFFPSTDYDSYHASQPMIRGGLLSLVSLNYENPVIHDLYFFLGYPPAWLLLGIETWVVGGLCLCFDLCSFVCGQSES